MSIGYIGLGAMGGALARRLMLTHKLRVYDLNSERVQEFADAGAIPTQSPAALAAECEQVLVCLPTSNEVRAVLFGENGVAGAHQPGAIVADMTTGDPNATKAMAAELKASGYSMELIDAPVSGGPHGAEAGTIAIMVGASEEQFARMKPTFEAISPNIFHCGKVGAGHTMKLVNNMVAAGVRAITFEAVTMGVKNGLTLQKCAEVLDKSSGHSYTTQFTLPRMANGFVPANFQTALMLKDTQLATQIGAAAAAPMPLAGLVREIFRAALVEHGPTSDVNTLIRSMERAADVKVVPD